MSRTITDLYMCQTDFDYELGNAAGGNVIFASLEDAKEHLKCWESCGIVEVKVTYVRTAVDATDEGL